ncbi:nuclear transport factor 2 family protein [uncultured Umboniibacter sp.]|uniref:nuclear transport factor 2 family protein n=1 Tax=uncultured Umboniibacter sp. TaxID=1798917 RepID=UPI002633A309|nr:nuclear transport factor 2 family protein [uncultured Umboniibacter sp.]
MYKSIKYSLALSLLLLAGGANASLESEVEDRLNWFLSGVNDVEVHDEFWASDLIYTSSSGTRFGKSTIIDGMRSSTAPEQESSAWYGAENVTVRSLGEAVILTFELTLYESAESSEPAQRYFNTGVLIKRDGSWQATAWQATKAAE